MWKFCLFVILVSIITSSRAQHLFVEDCEGGKSYMAIYENLYCDHSRNFYRYYDCSIGIPMEYVLDDCDATKLGDSILLPTACSGGIRYSCTNNEFPSPGKGMCHLVKHNNKCDGNPDYELATKMMEWTNILGIKTAVFQYDDLVILLMKNGASHFFNAFFTEEKCEIGGSDEKYIFSCDGFNPVSYTHRKVVYTDMKGNPAYADLTRRICSEEDGLKVITINYSNYSLEIEYDQPNCEGEVINVEYVEYLNDESTYSTNAYSFVSGSLLLKYYSSEECDDKKFRKSHVYFNNDACSINEKPEYNIKYENEKQYKLKVCETEEEYKYDFDKCYKRPNGQGYIKVENLMISPVIEESKCDDLNVHCHIDGEVHLEDKMQGKNNNYMIHIYISL